MAALRNPRHERFAQLLAEGITQVEAYRRAGYRGRAESLAARLAGRADIRARVAAYLESDRLRRTGAGAPPGPVSGIRAHKLEPHRAEIEALIADGNPRYKIAAKFKVSHVTLKSWLDSRGIPYTPTRVSVLEPHRAEIEALIAAGKSRYFIAEKFNTTERNLTSFLRVRGITYTPKRGPNSEKAKRDQDQNRGDL